MSVCILWKIIKKQREKIVGLKKVYRLLGERCTELLKDKGNLIDKTTELQHKVDTLQGFLDHDIEYDMDKTIQTLKKENADQKDHLTKAKEIICEYVRLANLEKEDTVAIWQLYHKAEQFLRETDIDNAIQKANEGLDLDKIADEVEQDIKEQKVK